MADATTMYKGATSLRKFMAMFEGFEAVETAMRMVPNLEKEIETLKSKRDSLQDDVFAIKDGMETLKSRNADVQAEAHKIRDDAIAEAATIVELAEADAKYLLAEAKAGIDISMDEWKRDRAAHLSSMEGAEVEAAAMRAMLQDLEDAIATRLQLRRSK